MPRTKKETDTSSKSGRNAGKRQDVDHVALAFRWLKDSSFGHFVLVILVILLVIGVDILLTGNSLSAFLLVFGIEFLLVNMVIWLVVVLRQRARARREAQSKD